MIAGQVFYLQYSESGRRKRYKVVLQPCQQLRSLTGWSFGDLTGSIDLSGSKTIVQNLTMNGVKPVLSDLLARLRRNEA